MIIRIQSTLLELTDPLRAYAQKRFAGLAKHLKRYEAGGEYTLELEVARTTRHHRKGDVYYVEATIRLRNKTIRIEQKGEDIRACIDAAKKRLGIELERYKEKSVEKDRVVIRRARRGIE